MIFRNRQTRRQFLSGSGKSFLAIPFLSSLWPETSHGAVDPNKKFVAIVSKLGQRHEFWQPFQTGTLAGGYRQMPLTAFNTTGINHILTAKFAPFHSKMLFFKGLDGSVQSGHNAGEYALGVFARSDKWQTIDQVIGSSSAFYGGVTPTIPVLLLRNSGVGANTDLNLHGMPSFKFTNGRAMRMPGMNNPRAALDRLFALADPALKATNIKIVDRVLASYKQVQAHRHISSADKAILQNYIDSFNDIENRIANVQGSKCTRPVLPAVDIGSSSEPLLKAYSQVMNDILVLALSCNATRVANYLVSRTEHSFETVAHGWSHITEDEVGGIDAREKHKLANRWIAETIVLDLVQKMSRVVESNGKTLLDNSLVFWGNEFSCGSYHQHYHMPAVTFGSANGFLKTGKLLDYTGYNVGPLFSPGTNWYPGRLYNQLLVTILQSMGLTPADYERPDQVGYGFYGSSNPARRTIYAQVEKEHHLILPGV